MGADGRHYNINKLNFLFAMASLFLLGLLGAMFLSDYSRDWKEYQNRFRELEVEKTRVKYDLALNDLKKTPEYQQVIEDLASAKKEFTEKCAGNTKTQNEIDSLKQTNDIAGQQFRVKKSQLDAAKFRYEEALANHDENTPAVKKEYLALKKTVDDMGLKIEQTDAEIAAKQALIDECSSQLEQVESKERALTAPSTVFERKLKKIDPNEMSIINRLAQIIRNLPVLELSNPTFRIQQTVLKDITEDVNFMQVPRVDRCTTCHLGIDNPDYKDAPQPFTTHPNLELYLSKDSAHPIDEFGCTVCHEGRGRGTDFVSAAHTPSTQKQEEAWVKKYNWHELHDWDNKMLARPYMEASCLKCHSGSTVIKGAEKLNLGLNIIEKSGCYACHRIERYKDWPKPGPDLTRLSSKMKEDWAYNWIASPTEFRPDTRMPSFFAQSNNNDTASIRRSQQEIHAIVHYLFTKSDEFNPGELPFWGNAQKGKELFDSVGCLACHKMEKDPESHPLTRADLDRKQGPNLIGLGAKTSKEWIFKWLKDPNAYHPGTLMPNLRLSDKDAADIASYLMDDKSNENTRQLPPVDETVLNDIIRLFLRKTASEKQTDDKIAGMSTDEKLLYAGEKLIGHHGCYSCHNIKGFENYKPIGTELTTEGSKDIHNLDFGYIPIPHTRYDWFTQKLHDPRIFDQDKIKNFDEKLRMPNYYFTDQEIEAVVTALLSFVNDHTVRQKKPKETPETLYIENGEKLIRIFNCQGCHIIEGEGGAIRPEVVKWLVEYDNRSEGEAESLVGSFSPPNLIGEGKRVKPQWLFDFLHDPVTIRPWLKVRMPTYGFDADHLNTFIKYFNALDHEPLPFSEIVNTNLTTEEFEAGRKLFSNDYFDCGKCHIIGDKMPSGSPDSWAPNFALSKNRLKPQWVSQWLKNPQDLLPGTKMPTYFDPNFFDESGPPDVLNGDENLQIKILRNFLYNLTTGPATGTGNAGGVPVSSTDAQ